MEAINCGFSDVVLSNYKSNVHKMQNIPDTGFDEASKGNFNFIGIRAHTGIVRGNDDLLVLDPEISQKVNDFDVCIEILYELAKLRGKDFVGWQEVLIDSDCYQAGKLVFLQRHQSPHTWDNRKYSWQGETILCSPNDRLIQYAIQRVDEVRKRRNR
jgi:hypothetical protein